MSIRCAAAESSQRRSQHGQRIVKDEEKHKERQSSSRLAHDFLDMTLADGAARLDLDYATTNFGMAKHGWTNGICTAEQRCVHNSVDLL